jgi:hypothetical protein
MLLVNFLGSWFLFYDKLKGTGANILYSFLTDDKEQVNLDISLCAYARVLLWKGFAWTGWNQAKSCRDWHAIVPFLRSTTVTPSDLCI